MKTMPCAWVGVQWCIHGSASVCVCVCEAALVSVYCLQVHMFVTGHEKSYLVSLWTVYSVLLQSVRAQGHHPLSLSPCPFFLPLSSFPDEVLWRLPVRQLNYLLLTECQHCMEVRSGMLAMDTEIPLTELFEKYCTTTTDTWATVVVCPCMYMYCVFEKVDVQCTSTCMYTVLCLWYCILALDYLYHTPSWTSRHIKWLLCTSMIPLFVLPINMREGEREREREREMQSQSQIARMRSFYSPSY